jgi:hypothetical protein
MLTQVAARDMIARERYETGLVWEAKEREMEYSAVQLQGKATTCVAGGSKVATATKGDSPLARHAWHVWAERICCYGSSFAYWRRHRRGLSSSRVGCSSTGQGGGGSGRSQDERSLNWRAEPGQHARLECIEGLSL